MADKKAEKNQNTKKKGGGIGAMLPKVFGILSVLSAATLFAAALDIGHLGLADSMGVLTAIPLGLYALLGLAGLFMAPKGGAITAAEGSEASGLSEEFANFKSKSVSRFAAMESRLDMISGQDQETLIAENAELKAQLDAIHQTERDKVDEEIEKLRLKNVELEEQIKQWARNAVSNAVGGDAEEPQQAA